MRVKDKPEKTTSAAEDFPGPAAEADQPALDGLDEKLDTSDIPEQFVPPDGVYGLRIVSCIISDAEGNEWTPAGLRQARVSAVIYEPEELDGVLVSGMFATKFFDLGIKTDLRAERAETRRGPKFGSFINFCKRIGVEPMAMSLRDIAAALKGIEFHAPVHTKISPSTGNANARFGQPIIDDAPPLAPSKPSAPSKPKSAPSAPSKPGAPSAPVKHPSKPQVAQAAQTSIIVPFVTCPSAGCKLRVKATALDAHIKAKHADVGGDEGGEEGGAEE